MKLVLLNLPRVARRVNGQTHRTGRLNLVLGVKDRQRRGHRGLHCVCVYNTLVGACQVPGCQRRNGGHGNERCGV
jgi:hypothetical protein